MEHAISIGLALVILLGVGAQWIAHKIQMPSILLLIVAGLLAGPFLYAWQPSYALLPDRLFGNLLFPIVSISVGIILFEGGLSLNLKEITKSKNVILRLLSVGVLLTWVGSTLLAWWLLDFEIGLALLMGAILTVTGPTVIGPMLRHIRPTGECGPILKWEGILVDPIGAILAVLVYELLASDLPGNHQILQATWVLAKTLISGILLGGGAALVLVAALQGKHLPEFLHAPVAMMLLVASFTAANVLQEESGLLATTIMGVVLANQKKVPIRHIVEFKEVLRTLLISSIFILLAANIRIETLKKIDFYTFAFLGGVLLLIRPFSVLASTLGSPLPWKQRAFLASLAPRGIVAAAVASVFAIKLEHIYPNAELLNSTLFFVIVGSIAIYGLAAPPIARLLGISGQDPQGILVVGAHHWARQVALRFQEEGFRVLLVDTNTYNISTAESLGLQAFRGNILDDYILDKLDLEGIGYLLALTSNDEANALACLQFADIFGKDHIYQIAPWRSEDSAVKSLSRQRHYGLIGQCLLGQDMSFGRIADLVSSNADLQWIALSGENSLAELENSLETSSLETSMKRKLFPFAVVDKKNKLEFFSGSKQPDWKESQKMLAFVGPAR